MNAQGDIVAGFQDVVLDSQMAFRHALEALSRPGKVVDLGAGLPSLPGLCGAAASFALALLDQDTRLWLSPGCATASAAIRFHTGCRLTADCEVADFGMIAMPRELPALARFSAGSELYPDRSATLILQVPELREGEGWRLSGPGIRDVAGLDVAGLGTEFVRAWTENHERFPLGVDLFLASGSRLCGLPRTVRIEA